MLKIFSFFVLIYLCLAQTHGLNTRPLVSVIALTYERPEYAPVIYSNFKEQTYPNRELLILDDSSSPSEFFLILKNDSRVRYWHSTCKRTIGGKRNFLIKRSAGSIIAHFDDDDYYAPDYLTTMINELQSAKLPEQEVYEGLTPHGGTAGPPVEFVKSSKWLAWREQDKTLWEWDTTYIDSENGHYHVSAQQPVTLVKIDAKYQHASQWGFGFSYVYLKSFWQTCRFPLTNFGEDYQFVTCGFQHGKQMKDLTRVSHLIVHTIHLKSSSWIYPQKQGPTVPHDPWLLKIMQVLKGTMKQPV